MEKQTTTCVSQEGGGKPPATTPAYFVILQQSQGNGKKEEGIVVANRDVSSVAPLMSSGSDQSKSETFLSADCTSGKITVTLDNNNTWNEFYRRSTEMVLTKQGRRMFPYCRYWISGLVPFQKYILVMDIAPLDSHRYKWNGKWWETGGKSEPHVLGRVFIHPESPSTGQYWMHQPVSFYKLKLTNNILDQEGHIILHSMHRYVPRLHVVPASQATEVIQLNGPDVHTFTFPQTEFIAVTAYQNFQITQLKIDCNPFAKGFREGAVTGKPGKDSKPKNSDQEMDSPGSKMRNDSESIRKLREIFKGSELSDPDTETEAFNSERDFLNFMNPLTSLQDVLQQKADSLDSPVRSCLDSGSCAESPIIPNVQPNVEIKEEPEDNYDYGKNIPTEGVNVKQEQSEEEETDEYSNSDDDYPILVRQLAQFKAESRRERKRFLSSPTRVDKAKLLKLDNGKKKLPFLLPKPSVTQSNESHNTQLQSVKSKRGRPRKLNFPKLGQPAKKVSPVEAVGSFPDVKPDLEDVDGVLFVAFSSKEALDVHTGGKTKRDLASSFPVPPVSNGEKDNIQTIPALERQLIAHLRSMRHNQVIHPALQQVGLKLNIVDPTMSIDLRYLGVELPLPYITNSTRIANYGLCAQASGSPFVSRTGKTTDYTKIKGWRDKFSSNSTSLPNEGAKPPISGSSSESSLKNRSAFCSDELDEYLENEAKLMERCGGLSQNEQESSLSYALPTKSTSCLQTQYSALTKPVPSPSPSSNVLNPVFLPSAKKQPKAQRKSSTSKTKSKSKPVVSPANAKEKAAELPIELKPASSDVGQIVPVVPTAVPLVEESMLPGVRQSQQQISLRPFGLSKAQAKLMELEECAICEGKPRTYVTEERADISLATLLTAQASLKNKPIHKMIRKRESPCSNEFCRLGCICQSLSHPKYKSTHCRRVDCMLSCSCLKSRLLVVKGELKLTSLTESTDEKPDGQDPDCIAQEESHVQELGDDEGKSDGIKAQKKNDIVPRFSEAFPIWNKPEGDSDPEPICIPAQADLDESKLCAAEVHSPEKMKNLGATKPGRNTLPSLDDVDPVFMYFEKMMTCARVRVYERKSPEEKLEDQCKCDGLDVTKSGVEKRSLFNGAIQSLLDMDVLEPVTVQDSAPDIGTHKSHNVGPNKLIEIISDCTWEEDRNKILSIVSQHMNSKEPQSFKVGSFNIELTSENKSGNKLEASTSSRVKISMAPGLKKDWSLGKVDPVKWKTESIKLPERKPSESIPEKEKGGKGLPFYTKVIPAGKLVAHLKNSNINQSELIQVNGKNYPQAKLLLGQMGALHPANRLAAYITHRLRPSLYSLAKLSDVNSKAALNPTVTSCIVDEKFKDIPAGVQKVVTTAQTKTAAQFTSSSKVSQFVLNEVGFLKQKLPKTISALPAPGLQKPGSQTTRLMIITSGKQTPVIGTTCSMVMTSTSTQSCMSAPVNLGTISPSQDKAVPSLPTLLSYSKLLPKESSVPKPTGSVTSIPTDPACTVASTSVNSPKEPPVPPPSLIASPLVKALPSSTAVSSTLNLPELAKNITPPSIVRTLGSSSPQAGVSAMPTLTLKPVPQPTIQVARPSAVPTGMEKRLGPRLLLIPVQSSSPNVRPAQCVPQSPGQKMVLQPIRSPGGVNLFRHPNGQIIQLVPLQQVSGNSVQTSNQQVVFRNPGSITGVRLPIPKKHEVTIASSRPFVSSTASPVSSGSVVSLSKTSPVAPGVTIVPQGPSFLSQTGTLRLRIVPPSSSSEVLQSNAKVITYTSGGKPVNSASVMPLQSGSFALLKMPSQTVSSTVPNSSSVSTLNKPGTQSNDEEKQIVLDTKEKNDGAGSAVDDRSTDINTQNKLLAQDQEPDKIVKSTVSEQNDITDSDNQICDKTDSLDVQSSVTPMDNAPNQKAPDAALVHETMTQSSKETESECNPKPREFTVCAEEQNTPGNPSQETPEKSVVQQSPSSSKAAAQGSEFITITCKDLDLSKGGGEKEIAINCDKYQQVIDCTMSDSNSDGTPEEISDIEESVDIETVEELSEKINIARLKATAIGGRLSNTKGNAHAEYLKGRKRSFKKENMYTREAEEDPDEFHRRTHTANERKRRNEMRDLFEELKNALGLHNLPKVSKSYILKQAIEEIEGLTDQADTLIRKKTLLSQKQTYLIKKVSNLSGKPREVVVKKLEYLYAKQKAVEAERRKKNLEEDIALHEATMKTGALPKNDPFPSLRKEDQMLLPTSSKSKRPLILARRLAPAVPAELKPLAPSVSLQASSLLMTSQGPLLTLKNPVVSGQGASIPSTVLQAEINPQVPGSGISSVVIQLPGTIQVKSLIGNTSIPITLAAVPSTAISGVVPPTPEVEKEDLSMMPKIVNVTSLATEASAELDGSLGLSKQLDEEAGKTDTLCSLNNKIAEGNSKPEKGTTDAVSKDSCTVSSLSATSVLQNNTEESISGIPEVSRKTQESTVVENLPPGVPNTSKEGSATGSKLVSIKETLCKSLKGIRGSRREVESKKVISSIEDAALDPTELIDVIGDQEDSDETLTSLLNELEFLNQQLDNDSDDLDSGSDFPGSDAASRGSASKFTDGDSSPFSFGRFKELSEIKDKGASLSPLFMQLEEGEVHENIKQNKDVDIMRFVEDSRKDASSPSNEKICGLQENTAGASSPEMVAKQETCGTDTLWRPMPKLAPLGLKNVTLSGDQRGPGSKAMPCLAPVTIRLNSPKTFAAEEPSSSITLTLPPDIQK
ncbi:MAX gene-associated protein [Rhinophrynus dorsalis]